MVLSFSQEHVFSRTPMDLWQEIIHSPETKWPLGLNGTIPSQGDAVLFDLHIEGSKALKATGRVTLSIPGSKLVIQQESPWQSKIIITLKPLNVAGQTRVRLIVTLEEDGVDWFFPWQAEQKSSNTETETLPLGLLTSLSGCAGIFSRGAINAATLAIEELNSVGGILGRKLRLVVADDGAMQSSVGAYQELARQGCQTILAMCPTPTVEKIRRYADKQKRLVIHTPLNEGGAMRGMVYQFGPRPYDQLARSIPYLMRETGEKNWFIAGNNYSWPRAIQKTATQIIQDEGGRVVGSSHISLDETSFESTLNQIHKSKASLVLSSFVGSVEAEFEIAAHKAGLRDQTVTLATLLDGTTLQYIPKNVREGIYATIDDFDLRLGEDSENLQKRWELRFGVYAPPLSSLARSVYEAVHIFVRAATRAQSTDPLDVSRALKSERIQNSVMLARAAGTHVPSSIVRLGVDTQTLVAI